MNNSDYIALCSAFVALCAFSATIWQGWLSFQHNRLSTKPHIVWHINRSSVGQNGSSISFSVKNLGLGPAIIKDQYLTHDGVKTKSGFASSEVSDLVKALYGQKIPYQLRRYGLPGIDSAIASGEEFTIASIEFPTTSFDNLQTAIDLAGNVGFHLVYESLYKQRFELHQT